ncbi:hypothetical protein L7F22_053835 [Adiantum nelumboides]|nr:hypothetical protein [Adiantum nelumboides]
MATKFPAQQQQEQPGREHEMQPIPEFVQPNYKPADILVSFCDLSIMRYAGGQASSRHLRLCGHSVNNAREQHAVFGIESIPAEQVERVFRTNIFSQFYLTKYVVIHMKESICIINTTSVIAYKGNVSLLDYTSTKGAIVAFTRGLALHRVGRGIRVSGVASGPIWTPLIPSSFPPEKVESFGEQVPIKRAAQPSEVGPSYVFLASEDSSYYSGQLLHPNGMWSMLYIVGLHIVTVQVKA